MNTDLNFLTNRGTVREYTKEEVSTEVLNELLEAAFQSSTTGNMQLYSVIVTRNQEKKEQLAPLHFNQPQLVNAPVVLTFCADFNRFNKWCYERNAEPGYDNFGSFITAVLDTTIVTQTFCVAAEKLGLGICYLGTTSYSPKEISEVLKLPKFVFPITTITLGYPQKEMVVSDRLPLNAIVHEEEYSANTPERINAFYKEKEALPLYQDIVLENKKENLAQVFTDCRYTKENNEIFSKKLWDFYQEQWH